MKANDNFGTGGRRFLRAVAATLLGMALVVGSLFLVWQRYTPTGMEILAGMARYRAHGPLVVVRNGFAVGVWRPLTLCAVVAGSALLWNDTRHTRLALLAVQSACSLACFVIPLARFAAGGTSSNTSHQGAMAAVPLPGVLIALVGSALLMLGALGRYQAGVARETDPDTDR